MTQFYQTFPTLVLQATNSGVRRPGSEARYRYRLSTKLGGGDAQNHYYIYTSVSALQTLFVKTTYTMQAATHMEVTENEQETTSNDAMDPHYKMPILAT